MALATAPGFASFDITDKSQILDISPILSEALYLDTGWLRGQFHMDDAVEDTTYYWNEEALNARTATLAASASAGGTSISLTSGHGARFAVGDLIYDVNASPSTEVSQVTAISTDTLTVVRAYNSTAGLSMSSGTTIATFSAYQENSDFTADKSVKPVVRSNLTQIIFAGDLQISRSQRNRRMATVALDVDRQLANRAIELKFDITRVGLYGEKSASSGSDTVYRTCGGMRNWIRDNGGVVDSTAASLTSTNINSNNKTLVDRGKYVDTLLLGTDLVYQVAAIDSSNRRLLESDTQVGYTVQQVVLQQGNVVNIVIDGRVKTGDVFLYDSGAVTMHPFAGSGMFVIAATDFTDGVKRRIGSEIGLKFRNPEGAAYLHSKT
jgi:hypothetical protein